MSGKPPRPSDSPTTGITLTPPSSVKPLPLGSLVTRRNKSPTTPTTDNQHGGEARRNSGALKSRGNVPTPHHRRRTITSDSEARNSPKFVPEDSPRSNDETHQIYEEYNDGASYYQEFSDDSDDESLTMEERLYIKYDPTKFGMNNYDVKLESEEFLTDVLFTDAKQKSYVEHYANPLRLIYENGTTDDKLITSQVYENSPNELDAYVKQCVALINNESTIVSTDSDKKQLKVVHDHSCVMLDNPTFNIDLVENFDTGLTPPVVIESSSPLPGTITQKIKQVKPLEEVFISPPSSPANDPKTPKTPKSPQQTLSPRMNSVTAKWPHEKINQLDLDKVKKQQEKDQGNVPSPQSTPSPHDNVLVEAISMKKPKVEFKAEQRKGFVLDAFEKAFPVSESKKSLNLYLKQDTLLTKFANKDDFIEPRDRYLFESQSLGFDLWTKMGAPLEQVICRVALYESSQGVIKNFTKISSTFSFNCAQKSRALFTIAPSTDGPRDIFLLLKFARSFQGEYVDELDGYYMRGDKVKEKDVKSFQSKHSQFNSAMEKVYSPFGFAAMSLQQAISATGESGIGSVQLFLLPPKPGNVPSEFLLQMALEELAPSSSSTPPSIPITRTLSDMQHPTNPSSVATPTGLGSNVFGNEKAAASKKYKQIPGGKFDFSMRQISPPFPRVHAESCELMVKVEDKYVPVENTACFQHVVGTKVLDIGNDMFVMPLQLRGGGKEGFKNIQISVELRASDDTMSLNPQIVKCVCRSESPLLFNDVYSDVSLRNTTPEFSDEFKLKLPNKLTSKHHLLFKFWNVKHKEKMFSKKEEAIRTLVAYCFLPLLESDRLLLSGVKELPLYTKLPDFTYMSGHEAHNTERLEGYIFRVNLLSQSISHPADKGGNLTKFYRFVASGEIPSNLIDYLNGIKSLFPDSLNNNPANAVDQARFHCHGPVILNQLFEMLPKMGDEQAKQIVATIVSIADHYRVQDKSLLQIYVKYQFKSSFESFLENLLEYMYDIENRPLLEDQLLKVSWFIISLIVKGMIIAKQKTEDFSEAVYENVGTLVKSYRIILEKHIEKQPGQVKTVNGVLAGFLKHCLSLMDRAFIANVAVRYADLLGTTSPKKYEEITAEMQLLFYRELLSYHNYLILFLPLTKQKSVASISHYFYSNHFLYSAFIDVVVRCLFNVNDKIRITSIVIFRDLLQNMNRDPRYQDAESKERVHSVHFEFVIKLLDVLNDWRSQCDRTVKQTRSTLADLKSKVAQTDNAIGSKREALKHVMRNNEKSNDKMMKQSIEEQIKKLETSKTQTISFKLKLEGKLKLELERNRDEKRQLLACFVHIIQNVDKELMNQWLIDQSGGTQAVKRVHFIMALQLCLQAFEYPGAKSLMAFYTDRFTMAHATNRVEDLNIGASSTLQNLRHGNLTLPTQGGKRSSVFLNLTSWRTKLANIGSPSVAAVPIDDQIPALNLVRVKSPDNNSSQVLTSKTFGSQTPKEKKNPFEPTSNNRSMYSRSPDKKEYLIERLQHEKHMSSEVSFLVFSTLVNMIDTNILGLKDGLDSAVPSSSVQNDNGSTIGGFHHLLENIIRTFVNFLHLNQSEQVLVAVLTYLPYFFNEFSKFLFGKRETGAVDYVPFFTEELMCLCNSRIEAVRKQAIACLYLIVRFSFEATGDINRTQIMMTLALSRTLQHVEPTGDFLRDAFQFMSTYAYIDVNAPGNKRHLMKRTSSVKDDVKEADTTNGGFKQALALFQRIEKRTIETNTNNKVHEKMASFADDVEKLSLRLQNLLLDTISVNATIARGNKDAHKTEDLFYRISLSYLKIPELRFVWLQQLAQYHRQNSHYSEAALCYCRVLAFVFDYLKKLSSPIVKELPIHLFTSLVGHLSNEHKQLQVASANDSKTRHLQSPVVTAQVDDKGTPMQTVRQRSMSYIPTYLPSTPKSPKSINLAPKSPKGSPTTPTTPQEHVEPLTDDTPDVTVSSSAPEFTESGIIQLLRTTVTLFELAEYYEWTIPLHKILIALLERREDNKQLSEIYSQLHKVYDLIDQSTKEKARLFPNYYRLGFYGNGWDKDVDGKEFIYKLPKLFKLFKMKANVLDMFGQDVEIITNPKKPDLDTLDPNKRYVQLTHVKPYIKELDELNPPIKEEVKPVVVTPSRPSTPTLFRQRSQTSIEGVPSDTQPLFERKTDFQRSVNIHQFYYETAYSINAKKLSDKVTEVYKRKVIMTIEGHFPHVKTRLPVIKETEIVLTPIEAAIENMIEQCRRLEEVCTNTPPDVGQLQMVLQGSVRTTVNNGPKEIVESFLSATERSKYNADHVKKLNDKCLMFLRWCDKAVKLDAEYKRHDQSQFHMELEKGYEETKLLFDQHLVTIPNVQTPTIERRVTEEEKEAEVYGANWRVSLPKHVLQTMMADIMLPVDDSNM